MSWLGKGKNNKGKQAGEGTSRGGSDNQASNALGQRPGEKKQNSAEIRAQALANMRGARERLGDETIQKIAEALHKMDNSPTAQAKAKIAKITEDDADRVAAEILEMLETRH